MATVIDALIQRQDEILSHLKTVESCSVRLSLNQIFKKLLVMALGSFFEAEIVSLLERFDDENADPKMSSLIRNKALKRWYFNMKEMYTRSLIFVNLIKPKFPCKSVIPSTQA